MCDCRWRVYTTNYDLAVEKYWLDITDINDLITKDKSGRSIIDVNRLQEQEEQDRKEKAAGEGKAPRE